MSSTPNILKYNEETGHGPGRKPGSPNIITRRTREVFAQLLEEKLPQISEYIDRVALTDPKGAVELIIKISERFLPRLQQHQLTGAEGGQLDIKFTFGKTIELPQDFDLDETINNIS
jgi:hypothetical protein